MGRDQRRLAAIVSADVAGYSRLMGRDESETLAALKTHRRELIDPKITEYGGRIVKATGDGLLLEFPSVVEAVRCSVDVQRGMWERNAAVSPERRIEFRVGINVGDVIIDGDDIFGDGVNVAARLQTLAEPGNIYVSKVVRDQVLDKLNFAFQDLGPRKVKNIARPVEAFRVDIASTLGMSHSEKAPWQRLTRSRASKLIGATIALVTLVAIALWAVMHGRQTTAVHTSASSAIAVIPFSAPNGSLEEQQLADTITRDLTSMLGRGARMSAVVSQDFTTPYKGKAIDPRTIGQELAVLYLIEGQVRQRNEYFEITVQLVETEAARQIWNDRVEVNQRDLKTNPNKLVALLGDRIGSSIFAANMRRFAGVPNTTAGPFELTMHAWSIWSRDNNMVQGARDARKWFDRALAVDPTFVPAITGRFRTFYYELDFEPKVDKERVLKQMDDVSFLAVNIDNDNPATWGARANSLIRQGRWDAAFEAIAKVERLSWSNRDALALRAEIMALTGKSEEALALADRALNLEPANQEYAGWIMLTRCRAFMAIGRYDDAIAACEKNVALDNWWLPHLYLVAGYALAGQMAKAGAEKATLLDLRPSASLGDFKRYKYSANPEEQLLAGLRKAGLPEE